MPADPTKAAAEAERRGVAVDKLVAGRSWYAPNRRLLDISAGSARRCSAS